MKFKDRIITNVTLTCVTLRKGHGSDDIYIYNFLYVNSCYRDKNQQQHHNKF